MKTAVITGTSRRLGAYLAEKLNAEGYQVFGLTRQFNPAQQYLTQIVVDYQSADSVMSAIRQLQQHSSIELLIHNASLFEKDELHTHDSINFYQALFAVHMQLPALLNQHLAPLLAKTAGCGLIVHITDIYSENPNPAFSLYCSTKAGLENLMKSAAKAYAPKIRVNSIQPGPIMFLPEHSKSEKQQVMQQTLIAEEAGFEPIYQGVRFLIDNKFVTGLSLKIDGGRSLGK
ncbi:MAG: SDR family NAD(P)-dependent oxidoreductase [Gammaproteobacteria bacterium]|nr:SDR family NAD(P)-dependent oxidoreductase [Gammaproteobacteria bacterium]MBU2058166.1 SDR family NAD(P)-dependent oxidoreductase [Gammaproteobacteria bacterium]MBU2176901.1 SDR family NAD(P)-dependent oxidoreductase [Gammaproteobacteria bacterium]MBU2245560.1 SDR family NAD(P)-dependent oxidoreductase [Gammaproteobacteria bacterium]MBU2342748.1 SDR family NAD(P)-dependent oxidoreductase [Gammaproteobacteria bacterium]